MEFSEKHSALLCKIKNIFASINFSKMFCNDLKLTKKKIK